MTQSIGHTLQFLNHAFKADPEAVKSLLQHRVPCNEALSNDPYIQVREEADVCYSVSVLGLLNGILSSLNCDLIAATVETETGDISGFVPYTSPPVEALLVGTGVVLDEGQIVVHKIGGGTEG